MKKYYQRQIFDLIDPISGKKNGKTKGRVEVHVDGDWHLATTCFIVRRNKNSNIIEVLVQSRSKYVDIAQGMSDQSVATQLLIEDLGDTQNAISRGLREELDLGTDKIKNIVQWNKVGQMYVSKRYQEDHRLFNRELVSTYIVTLNDDSNMTPNFKVQEYEWLPWEEFVNLVRMHPTQFTKTSRSYCLDDSLVEDLHLSFEKTLENKPVQGCNGTLVFVSGYQVDTLYFDSKLSNGETLISSLNTRSLEIKKINKDHKLDVDSLIVGDKLEEKLHEVVS